MTDERRISEHDQAGAAFRQWWTDLAPTEDTTLVVFKPGELEQLANADDPGAALMERVRQQAEEDAILDGWEHEGDSR